MRFDDANKRIYFYPKDIIDQSYKAYQYDASLTTFLQGAPSGRYVAPAQSKGWQGTGVPGCIQYVSGDCALTNPRAGTAAFLPVRPEPGQADPVHETKDFELRAEFLNAFNNVNFYGASSIGGLSSGQITSAYTDSSQQQDNGGRMIQIVLRINF